ncbi:proline-serine-threonine phosphatase-interacting protein, putative [Entamoeba invadens IP1]|uniref:proline-serine-threonine phosphatase-interacting protein, putative n=1 Tax=Entamoeba invadens IP1 TaxID=370355 RepID=UPI0002C3F10A|nr:proline-serine-threonine phosphatase-interacting protein, putative [Entamoeba invadens IP1]ELP94180.1 proline-serine-threonine phosphatase-interacting protein, putative [Entamoeba invadens IP1]|eukprot:XP_004260951.1 proline-serine-threonine phosphatase-interacting protein, putative [Entamoeba invadens IP1]
MSFAENLIDGLDLVYHHSQDNTKCYTDFRIFLQKMTNERLDFEKRMLKIVQDYRLKKVTSPNTLMYGTLKINMEGYLNSIEEDLNTQSAITNIYSMTVKELETTIKELDKQSKALIAEGQTMTKNIAKQKEVLKKDRDNYVSCGKDDESAKASYQKSFNNPSSKAAKTVQLKEKQQQTNAKMLEAQKVYQTTLADTNAKIREFYTSLQPHILEQFQTAEKNFIVSIKSVLLKFAMAYLSLVSSTAKFVESTRTKFDSIDPDADINEFSTTKATNGHPPEDIFEYDYTGNIVSGNTGLASVTIREDPDNNCQMNSNVNEQEQQNNAQPIQPQQPQEIQQEYTLETAQVEGKKFTFPFPTKALYDYTAETDDELSFKQGDTILVVEMDQSGWCLAYDPEDNKGRAPQNYLKPA